MTASNRASIINTSYRVLKKHFQPVTESAERSVLEHWLYACCLENARYEKADVAYQRMIEAAFDWNEMRVTTVTELAEQLAGLPDSRRSASNVKRLLQSVFESRYSYDLENLKKQNLGKTIKEMLSYDGASTFSVSYVTQHALGGHSIPIDQGALEVMYIIGVINENEFEKGAVPGVERAIPKKNGIEYGSLLHQLGAALVASRYSTDVRSLFLEINPEAQPRLPKRRKKKTTAKAESTPAKTKKAKPASRQRESKKSAPRKTAKRAAAKKAKAVKKTKSGGKKTSGRKTSTSASKQLAKRKPR